MVQNQNLGDLRQFTLFRSKSYFCEKHFQLISKKVRVKSQNQMQRQRMLVIFLVTLIK